MDARRSLRGCQSTTIIDATHHSISPLASPVCSSPLHSTMLRILKQKAQQQQQEKNALTVKSADGNCIKSEQDHPRMTKNGSAPEMTSPSRSIHQVQIARPPSSSCRRYKYMPQAPPSSCATPCAFPVAELPITCASTSTSKVLSTAAFPVPIDSSCESSVARTALTRFHPGPSGQASALHVPPSLPSPPSLLPFAKRARLSPDGLYRPVQAAQPKVAASLTHPSAPSPTLLLALDCDREVLSPLHTFVRKQIEVFLATPHDLSQPAPGRKHPVVLRQVGLRCVHCRYPQAKRVKRAVCYPTSVERVYHSVSDMKFDHFSSCPSMPEDVRHEFETLKAGASRVPKQRKRSSSSLSSTSSYYRDAAVAMGMVNGDGGIFAATASGLRPTSPPCPMPAPIEDVKPVLRCVDYSPKGRVTSTAVSIPDSVRPRSVSVTSGSSSDSISTVSTSGADKQPKVEELLPRPVRLSSPSDETSLTPIHCFVRRHVEFFAADADDLAAPAPGRKAKVVLGQVGVRCVHCAPNAGGRRVKRSVCFPPSVAGVYHAVSNMKFDHFGVCPSLPAGVREELESLRAACGKRKGKGTSSTTARYYEESAQAVGLVDTTNGIRFRNGLLPLSSPSRSETREEIVPVPTVKMTTSLPSGFSILMMAADQAQAV